MSRVLPRTRFHSSALIRCLADLALADIAEPGEAFAEKLGLWIHFTDAITLHAVHNDGIASLPPFAAPSAAQSDARLAAAEFERRHAALVNAIVRSCSPTAVKAHIILPMPVPAPELPLDLAAAYAPYRRFYEAHQRDMELRVQPLRVNAREALAQASPRLKKLAELDATLENILRERESKLLSKVPALLRKRFDQLFREHQQRLAGHGQADNPAGWMQAGAWLARFCGDLQMLLLAELELRLQPAMGLMEALTQDTQ